MLLPVALALLQLSISSKPPSLVKLSNDEKAAASAPAPVKGADAVPAEPADEPDPANATGGSRSSSGGPASASASGPADSSLAAPGDSHPREDVEASSATPDSAANATATVAVEPTTASAPAEPYSSSLALAPASPAAMIRAAEKADEQRRWMERQKHIWLGLSIAQSSAAAFDAYSTRQVVGSGRGTEMNPLLRPFAGNASMYAAVQVGPVLIDYISRRMLMSHHSWMRRGWWVPQVAGTALSLISGARNMAILGGQ